MSVLGPKGDGPLLATDLLGADIQVTMGIVVI